MQRRHDNQTSALGPSFFKNYWHDLCFLKGLMYEARDDRVLECTLICYNLRADRTPVPNTARRWVYNSRQLKWVPACFVRFGTFIY